MNRSIKLFITFALLISLFTPDSVGALISPNDKVNGRQPSEYNISKDLLPDVSSPTGVLISSDGRILWERNADTNRQIAALNAIMTATVAIENADDLETLIRVPSGTYVGVNPHIELHAGEQVSLKSLITALLVQPVPQTSELIAEHIAGSRANFLSLMNAKSAELGLTHTHFSNVFGDDQQENFSSAKDLATLSMYAMQNEFFAEAASLKIFNLLATNSSGSTRKIQLINTNTLLWLNESATGVKGGISDSAGYVLSASATQDGITLYSVVLGTDLDIARYDDTIELFDFGFAHYRNQEMAIAGTHIGEAPVSNYLEKTVGAVIGKDLKAPILDFAGEIERKVTVYEVVAPVKKGDDVGVASFYQGDTLVATVPLVAAEDVAKPFILIRPIYWIINTLSDLF